MRPGSVMVMGVEHFMFQSTLPDTFQADSYRRGYKLITQSNVRYILDIINPFRL